MVNIPYLALFLRVKYRSKKSQILPTPHGIYRSVICAMMCSDILTRPITDKTLHVGHSIYDTVHT